MRCGRDGGHATARVGIWGWAWRGGGSARHANNALLGGHVGFNDADTENLETTVDMMAGGLPNIAATRQLDLIP